MTGSFPSARHPATIGAKEAGVTTRQRVERGNRRTRRALEDVE
jgi:hypothetical protein